MADKKISALTSASTPLAGTEVFPIVQSGSTVKATIANITAGRSIGDNIGVGTAPAAWVAYKSFDIGTQGGIASVSSQMQTFQNAVYNGAWAYKADGFAANYNLLSGQHVWQRAVSGLAGGAIAWIEDGKFDENGNFSVANGNITPGTAAKGVNFTANTPAAGMTSQLLNWYEEGTFTPTDGSGAGLTFTTATGKYVRVGRMVQVVCMVAYPVTASGVFSQINGLPFNMATGFFVGFVPTQTTGNSFSLRIDSANSYLSPRDNTGTQVLNSVLSGKSFNMTFTYQV